jgi:hypothetical protein
MSSAVHFTPENPIPISEWEEFSQASGIVFCPNVVGQKTFYFGGREGVQVTFGSSQEKGTLPTIDPMKALIHSLETTGEGMLVGYGGPSVMEATAVRPDFANASPPDAASEVLVSSYYLQNLDQIAVVVHAIWLRWPGKVSSCAECRSQLRELGVPIENDRE